MDSFKKVMSLCIVGLTIGLIVGYIIVIVTNNIPSCGC